MIANFVKFLKNEGLQGAYEQNCELHACILVSCIECLSLPRVSGMPDGPFI